MGALSVTPFTEKLCGVTQHCVEWGVYPRWKSTQYGSFRIFIFKHATTLFGWDAPREFSHQDRQLLKRYFYWYPRSNWSACTYSVRAYRPPTSWRTNLILVYFETIYQYKSIFKSSLSSWENSNVLTIKIVQKHKRVIVETKKNVKVSCLCLSLTLWKAERVRWKWHWQIESKTLEITIQWNLCKKKGKPNFQFLRGQPLIICAGMWCKSQKPDSCDIRYTPSISPECGDFSYASAIILPEICRQTDRQTDRRWCIRPRRAWAQMDWTIILKVSRKKTTVKINSALPRND